MVLRTILTYNSGSHLKKSLRNAVREDSTRKKWKLPSHVEVIRGERNDRNRIRLISNLSVAGYYWRLAGLLEYLQI